MIWVKLMNEKDQELHLFSVSDDYEKEFEVNVAKVFPLEVSKVKVYRIKDDTVKKTNN